MADENSGGSLELAKAYVQIVPSMKGVKAALAREFGDGGDSEKTFGSSFVKAALTAVPPQR